jgi:indolepyruvate ferredoxin oxidoreductase beta subunit
MTAMPSTERVRPITIAVLAMGGEGGGVLADWIVDLAEHGAYLAQATSVPGVAQRTGATIYYVELFPRAAATAAGRDPVLALMPVPGDVDLVLASEFMEAGRAVQRGLVTLDRTTLIASTHRVYAMTEKTAVADGRVDTDQLADACRAAAKRWIGFDMAALADATGSVISAVLFGALAGCGALPFPRPAFEAAIRRGGVGVEASLAAFAAGFEAARDPPALAAAKARSAAASETSPLIDRLVAEFDPNLDAETRHIIMAGIARLIDYQDVAYAQEFLARLRPVREREGRCGGADRRLLSETARQLALGMAYEDTIRVADLKTRADRLARVRTEVRLRPGQILEIAEFMHPRAQEIADTLPAGLGRWLMSDHGPRRLLDRLTRSGRVVRTTSIGGFLLLRTLAACKPWRRRSLRFAREQQSLRAWLDAVVRVAEENYDLAVEVARARELVKGYGDTYERGIAKFERLMEALPVLHARSDAASAFAELHKAALTDDGDALDKALDRMRDEIPSDPRLDAPARSFAP